MKKSLIILMLLALSLTAATPLPATAAAKQGKSEVVMKVGGKVHLFHSSKVDVQKDIAPGDVLTVYRTVGGKNKPPREVGQVKVLSLIGSHYFEAEILKGEVKVGDLAEKNGSSLLVQPVR